jgi:tRNA pseudouridine13 synthase
VDAARHTRKLQRGALRGNRFSIVLRQCLGEESALRERCAEIGRDGVPNYFGEQRFGRDGQNVTKARVLFAGTFTERDRHRRGIYLSAARAFLFNAVLAARIERGNWQTPLAGEACVLAGSHSFFVADMPDETILRRLAEQDIHLSGPMWGAGEPPTRTAVRELELAVVGEHADLAQGLVNEGLRQERRALRMIPQQLEIERVDSTGWRLAFSLPAGGFATAVLRELSDYQVADPTPPGDDEA